MAAYTVQIVAVLLAFCAKSLTYPHGAPPEACLNLNPTSHGPSTAKGNPPFKLTASAVSYAPNAKMTVILSGVGGAQFKGFLVEGRTAVENKPVGTFFNTTTAAKVVCPTTTGNNGITHTSAKPKMSATFIWQAPSFDAGDVIFNYTVVRGGAPNIKTDAADYFMNITTQPLKYSDLGY